MLFKSSCHLIVIAFGLFLYSGCQRSARQVVFENPCAKDKEGATSKNCNKPTTSTGGTGTGSDGWPPDDPFVNSGDSQNQGQKPPLSTNNNTGNPPLSGGGGSGGGGSGGGGSGGGGSGGGGSGGGGSGGGIPPSGGPSGSPNNGSNNQGGSNNLGGSNNSGGGLPPATPSDFTAVTKLSLSISKQGIPSLTFGAANQSKFSNLQFSTEAASFALPEANLKMQGQSNLVGTLELKVGLTFKYEGKSCTGSALAKIEQESSVTVKCE